MLSRLRSLRKRIQLCKEQSIAYMVYIVSLVCFELWDDNQIETSFMERLRAVFRAVVDAGADQDEERA
jgi:hypothetical protein